MKKPRKNIWKFLKYFLIGFLILIQFLALSTAFFIKTTPGNKQTANLISNFLEKKLDTKVSISKAIISRSSLRIYDLCVYDHKNEQVAYIKETEIDITKLRQTPGKFKIGKIKAVEADFYGRRYENDEFFNFQYIIQRLQTDKDPKKTQKKTIIKEIEVVDSKFRLRRPNRHKNKGLINFDDFSVEHIDANL